MGRTTASNPYQNKTGTLRIGVQFDYALALRIATGDAEATIELTQVIKRKVELFEAKQQADPDS